MPGIFFYAFCQFLETVRVVKRVATGKCHPVEYRIGIYTGCYFAYDTLVYDSAVCRIVTFGIVASGAVMRAAGQVYGKTYPLPVRYRFGKCPEYPQRGQLYVFFLFFHDFDSVREFPAERKRISDGL